VYDDLILSGKLGELQEDETDGGGRKKRHFCDPVISHGPKFEKHWFRIPETSLNKP